jgi:hypothetical protein
MSITFNIDPALMSSELRRRAWMSAREESHAAYRAWSEAEEPDRKLAYAVYLAAEEREAAAADAFGVG